MDANLKGDYNVGYRIVTVSIPDNLCCQMIMGVGTVSNAWDAYDILKNQIRKDEASISLARPLGLDNPSCDEYDQDALISKEYDNRSPGC